jgi:two-component system cell cycle sensor histidine kinase/response regulator CckA
MGNLEEAMSLLDEKPATDVSRSLRAATAACTATRDIVGRLLSPATETESCDVASAISMLASLLKPVIPPGVTLTLSDFRPGLNIPISSSSLQNVLCNLILNARDAVVAQGGSIHVSTHYESQRNLVTIAVEDDGPGIAPEIAPLLFQLYTTSKHQSGGTGLGLASCREAIVAAGGTIDAGHSPSLGGALFTISLPCEVRAPSSYPAPLPDDSRQGTERAQVFAPPQEQQQLRVLVADDEDSIRELLTVTLARKGYAVAGVGDSQLLLSKLSEEPGRFDVVVVDDSLQRQGSAHLVSQLRALSPQTSIIVVSGDHSVREDLIRLQTNVTFLAKPFSLSDLEGAIRSSCGRRL